jgi:hypothetical protein
VRFSQMQAALFVNLLGAGLILVAFQPASSPRSIVTDRTAGKLIAMCEGNSRVYLGGELPQDPEYAKCPDGIREPIATVEFENQWLFRFAVLLLIVGTAWQIWLVRPAPA